MSIRTILSDFEEYSGEKTKYKIEWKDCKPDTDPFEAAAGDYTSYQVHLAYVEALQEEDVLDCIHQVISKTLTYAQENIRQNTKYVLIYWDGEYAIMTIVYCDEMWIEDSFHVVKCCFRYLDKFDLYKTIDEDGNDDNLEYYQAIYDIEEMIINSIEITLKLPYISNAFKQLKEKDIHLCYTHSAERDFIQEIIIDSNNIKYQVIKE